MYVFVCEVTVSGYHADNIAPALLGGFVLVRYKCLCLSVRSLSVGTMQITLRRLCLGVLFLSGMNEKKGKESTRPFGISLMKKLSTIPACPGQVRMFLSVRLCFCQLDVCLSMVVSGVFALYVSNAMQMGIIRTVQLCEHSMHETCWVSDTKIPIWHFVHSYVLCCCIIYGPVHYSWTAGDLVFATDTAVLCVYVQ